MGTDGHVQDVHVLNGCSTRSFGDGFGITDALTGRRSIRRCGNWIDRWPAGLIGNTRSCAGICAGQPTGSRVSRDAIRSCGRTGRWACGVAPWREPYELRGSSTVLREARGEIPRAYSPGGGVSAPGGSRALSERVSGAAGEVRTGAAPRQDAADRVREVRTGEPESAGRRRTGKLHVSGVHARVR